MAQFTPTGLARLLRNVEKSVLVDAIEEADLWDLFSSPERQVLLDISDFLSILRTVPDPGVEPRGWEYTVWANRLAEFLSGFPLVNFLFRSAARLVAFNGWLRESVQVILAALEAEGRSGPEPEEEAPPPLRIQDDPFYLINMQELAEKLDEIDDTILSGMMALGNPAQVDPVCIPLQNYTLSLTYQAFAWGYMLIAREMLQNIRFGNTDLPGEQHGSEETRRSFFELGLPERG